MLLAVERGDDLRLFGFDLQPKPPSLQPDLLFKDDPAELTAILLGQRLSDLGIASGPIAPAPVPNR